MQNIYFFYRDIRIPLKNIHTKFQCSKYNGSTLKAINTKNDL